jgi:WD40 repeat protein
VIVWDVDAGHATHSFRGHEAVISAVAFAPHPASVQRLVSGSEDGAVRVWDLITSSPIITLSEHSSAVTSIAFSPDPSGALMLTAGRDRVLHLWDTRDFTAATAATGGAGGKAGAPSAAAIAAEALKATIPAHESVEGIVVLPLPPDAVGGAAAAAAGEAGGAAASGSRDFCFVTAGDRGVLRKWRLVVSGATRATHK